MKKTNAKKENLKRRSSKGITLIALVITIIVLLILAGVSIAMLTGENGVLTKASEAKEETNREGAREKLNLILNGLQADKIPKGEKLELGDELASEIAAFDEVTSATYTGTVIEVVIDGYTFEVNADIGIDDKKEIAKVEPDNLDDWEWRVEDDGTVTILKYNGDATKLVIPNYIDGHWVKKVGDIDQLWNEDKCEAIINGTSGTYYFQNDIVEIIISEGIEELDNMCFDDVTNLEKVSIPNTVRRIGVSAFGFSTDVGGKKRENFILNIPSNVVELERYIVGRDDTINVEFKVDEIPDTWEYYWNFTLDGEEVRVNYGVNM